MTRLVLHPRGTVSVRGLRSGAKAFLKTTGFVIGSAVSAARGKGRFPSGRQLTEHFCFQLLKPYRSTLGKEMAHPDHFFWKGFAPADVVRMVDNNLCFWGTAFRFGSDADMELAATPHVTDLPPSSSHYSQGVILPKTVRDQLVRAGMLQKKGGMTSMKMLSEADPVLPCLGGEIDLCQEMRFDHNATEWVLEPEFCLWDLEERQWTVWIPTERRTYPFLFHKLRHLLDSSEYTNQQWMRAMAMDAPGLIHTVLGELNLERITYLVSEPSLQRAFELKLFRPFVLSWVCSLKPAFVNTLLHVFRHAINAQRSAQYVAGELYLRFLLFRILEELRCVGDLPHIRAAYASVEADPGLQLSSRLVPLMERLLAAQDDLSSNQQSIQLYQAAICNYYLLWMQTTYGDRLSVSDPMAPVLLVSYAIYRASTNGLGPTKVDRYTCQRLEDWILALFQTWKPLLVVNGTPTQLLGKILFPFVRYFTQTESPGLIKGLETAKWRCEGRYPTFITQLNPGAPVLTVQAASGLFFIDQVMQAFVSYEHASHGTYQRYFGSLILRGSLSEKAGWSIYRCPLFNNITQQQDEYIIKAQTGDLFIFRQTGKDNRWYQFLPEGLPSITTPTPEEAFPAFIRESDIWIRQRAVWWKYRIYCSTQSRDPQQSVIHHGVKCYSTEQGVVNLGTIQRFPTREVVHYLSPTMIPVAIKSFEHPWYIEFGERSLYFPRFRLSFTRRSATHPWLSDDFPGYTLSDDPSVNPFHDHSAYWLALERKRGYGHVSYLLVAGCFPLLPHPPQEGGLQWERVRRGTRGVWIDHQISTAPLVPYITLRVNEEYPSLLLTSSSEGHCWLVLLYLAKRDYYNCLLLISQISFDTQLVPEQLAQLHRVLRWHDNSVNGCVVKLKIIAALARSDPNLLRSADSSQKDVNPLQGNKPAYPPGRFTESLLGLTQEEFFDFYLTAASTRDAAPFSRKSSSASEIGFIL